jgi:type I restriction enzyme M protein
LKNAEYGDVPAFLEKDSFYRSANVFYISKTARWSYIVIHASADDIAVIIDKAMADEDRKQPLKGALSQNFYAHSEHAKSRLRASSTHPQALSV